MIFIGRINLFTEKIKIFVQKLLKKIEENHEEIAQIAASGFLTPVAGSISSFRPLSQTHISKREFKNGHISRFCSIFQVIQVISSGKFFSAKEVDLCFNSKTKERPQISNPSFWKRDHENVFLQMF